MDWQTMLGLVGVTIVISGSNLLPQIRAWLREFTDPTQPLRWLGVTLEFFGLVTDKAMAMGFTMGLIWWVGELPWGEVLICSGILALLSSVADVVLAIAYASVGRIMGRSQTPAMPMTIPRTGGIRGRQDASSKLARGETLTEEEAFLALEDGDDEVDAMRGVSN